jgi:hypothetical protein
MYFNGDDERQREETRVNTKLEHQKRERLADEHAQSQREQRKQDHQQHVRDSDDWHKTLSDRLKYGGVQPSLTGNTQTAPHPPGSATAASAHISDDGDRSILYLSLLLALVVAPPFMVYSALGSLVREFPHYAADHSFAGQVAKVFVQGLWQWSHELEAFHWLLSFRLRNTWGWDVFFYGVKVWLLVGAVLFLLWCLFRVHKALGLAAIVALLGPIGLFLYVQLHF